MSEKLTIVNTLSGLLTVQRGREKYRFAYNKPVEIDYSEDATIIGFLLRNVELNVCNEKMLAELEKKSPKVVDKTVVEKVAETKKEEQAVVEKKVNERLTRKKKAQKKQQKYAEGMIDGVEEENDESAS